MNLKKVKKFSREEEEEESARCSERATRVRAESLEGFAEGGRGTS